MEICRISREGMWERVGDHKESEGGQRDRQEQSTKIGMYENTTRNSFHCILKHKVNLKKKITNEASPESV